MWAAWLAALSPDKVLAFISNIVTFIAGYITKSNQDKTKQLETKVKTDETFAKEVLAGGNLTPEQLADSLRDLTTDGGRPTVFQPEGPIIRDNSDPPKSS